MFELLKKLSAIPSASGYEKEMLSFIESEITPFCDGVSYDNMGNLIARRCGREGAERVMLCAYCDSAGYIVSYIEENGLLRLSKLGNPGTFASLYSRINIGGKIDGYIFCEKEKEAKEGDYSALYADIGAKNRAEAEKLVSLGDICTLPSEISSLCGTRIGGRGLSARVGAAVLIDVIKSIIECDKELYFAFAVQENLFHRGAKVVAFDVSPDSCICVDVCESLDTFGAENRGGAVLSDGAVILSKGSGFTSSPVLCRALRELSSKNNIKSKVCVYSEQSTACSAVSRCGEGVPSVCVCIPERHAGAASQVLDTNDMQCVKELILEYLK